MSITSFEGQPPVEIVFAVTRLLPQQAEAAHCAPQFMDMMLLGVVNSKPCNATIIRIIQ